MVSPSLLSLLPILLATFPLGFAITPASPPGPPAPAPPAGRAPPPPAAPLPPVNNGKCSLPWLELNLSPGSVIACLGSYWQQYNENRYWGTQMGKAANVVVLPVTSQDVADTVKVINQKAPPNLDWTFVSGAHSCINASSATGLVIDLSWLNGTQVLPDFQLPDGGGTAAVVTYQPGAQWSSINAVTAGSGYCAIGARVNSVGAGGFSTGGGIGFLGGAYGYAIDSIVQMEVVTMDGTIVLATKKNAYSDLFWALSQSSIFAVVRELKYAYRLQGGNGQFGIVTRFWVKAHPEPTDAQVGLSWYPANQTDLLRKNVVSFFNTNSEPHSLIYWVRGYTPESLTGTDLDTHEILVTLRFGDPNNSSQPSYDEIFSSVLSGLTPTSESLLNVPYAAASDVVTAFFPEGFRRLFNGPQVASIDQTYLNNMANRMDGYVNQSLADGDVPASAIFVLQYQNPGLSGNVPASDADTAWPHHTATGGHQTLFSPAWSSAANDLMVQNAAGDLDSITYARQAQTGIRIADYPNYIAPEGTTGAAKNGGWDGSRYWGANLPRLQQIKQKWDPKCLIRHGAVFSSPACVAGGWATVF